MEKTISSGEKSIEGLPVSNGSWAQHVVLMLAVAALQRAQEMDRTDPKLAYYCRMYAIELVGCLARPLRNLKLDRGPDDAT